MNKSNIVFLGTGFAGLSAAAYLARQLSASGYVFDRAPSWYADLCSVLFSFPPRLKFYKSWLAVLWHGSDLVKRFYL